MHLLMLNSVSVSTYCTTAKIITISTECAAVILTFEAATAKTCSDYNC